MKRVVKVGLIIGTLLLVILAIGFFGVGFWLSPQSPLQKADAIVAISGGDTSARTQMAVQLYQDGWSQKLIFSGAALDPNSISNAAVMAMQAEAEGVPKSAISLDQAATSTEENATGVAAIVKSAGYSSIILVTSPYHQRRASIVFSRALGPEVSIINHSSLDPDWRRSHWWSTAYSRQLTASELQKTAYELVFGN